MVLYYCDVQVIRFQNKDYKSKAFLPIRCILKVCVHHCVEVVVGFATGGHHLVVARLGEGKDKRTDDDDCHLVITCLGQQKKKF